METVPHPNLVCESKPTCDMCKKSFARKENLKLHMNAYHTDTHEKHHCQICQKNFSTRTNLNKHCKSRHGITNLRIRKPSRKQSSVKSKVTTSTETDAMTNPLETISAASPVAPIVTKTMTRASGSTSKTLAATTGFDDKTKPKTGSCEACNVINTAADKKCPSCAAKPAQSSAFNFGTLSSASIPTGEKSTTTKMGAPSLAEHFKPKPGTWSCKSCYTLNTAELKYCVCCEEPKYDTVSEKGQVANLFASNGNFLRLFFGFQ